MSVRPSLTCGLVSIGEDGGVHGGGDSCLQQAGGGWACRVSERLLPNANVGGGVAESGGWCLSTTFAVRAQQEPPPLPPLSAHPLHAQCRLSCSALSPRARWAMLMRAEAGAGGGHGRVRAVGAPVLSHGATCSLFRRFVLRWPWRFFWKLAARSGTRGGGRGSSALALHASPRPHTQRTRWPSDQGVGLALPRRFRSRAKSVGRPLFLFY